MNGGIGVGGDLYHKEDDLYQNYRGFSRKSRYKPRPTRKLSSY